MSDVTQLQEQQAAGPIAIAFDYQFYYFICVALQLKHGQKVGFEVKDDIHIDKEDGTAILYQAKHSIQKKEDGSTENLTTLDSDLWKTLSSWVALIKADATILSNHSFCLVTNKSEGNNKFIHALTLFKTDNDIDKVIVVLNELKDKTKDEELKTFITNVAKLGKTKSKIFFSKLSFEANYDDIIGEVKRKIYENIRNADLVDSVFETLTSNLHKEKYLDIKDRKKFEISFDEFNSRFGKCFRVAFKDKPLPKRKFQLQFPENLEEQTFIKQLIDIGEIDKSTTKIVDYTTQMLQAVNQLSYWAENNFVLPTEMDEFQKNSIFNWDREFKAKYRQIERKIKSGTPIADLETEIKDLGIELLDYMRRENLPVAGDTLGTELSNGHYYSLSDKPEIGWHFDWESKYKSA